MASIRLYAGVRKKLAGKATKATTRQQVVRLVRRLSSCKFKPRFRAGMTQSEANQAIDDAFNRFLKCLRGR